MYAFTLCGSFEGASNCPCMTQNSPINPVLGFVLCCEFHCFRHGRFARPATLNGRNEHVIDLCIVTVTAGPRPGNPVTLAGVFFELHPNDCLAAIEANRPSAARSCCTVPSSTTLPSAMVTTLEASITVLRRWAMVTEVRPATRRSNASFTNASDSTSNALVGSLQSAHRHTDTQTHRHRHRHKHKHTRRRSTDIV